MSAGGLFLCNGQGELHRNNIDASGTKKNMVSAFKILTQLTEKFGVQMSEHPEIEENRTTTEGTQTCISNTSSIDRVRNEAEFMAKFVVNTFGEENTMPPPNKYCKTLIRTVNELSVKHALVFKGIFNKLEVNDDDVLQTFIIVADEIFDEGQVNWGRIVSVYAFAGHLAKHIADKIDSNPEFSENQDVSTSPKRSTLIKDKIASFVGQYVANKLGQWIVNQGGWDAFVKYFPEPLEFETKMWKFGVLTAIGLGVMATVIGSR